MSGEENEITLVMSPGAGGFSCHERQTKDPIQGIGAPRRTQESNDWADSIFRETNISSTNSNLESAVSDIGADTGGLSPGCETERACAQTPSCEAWSMAKSKDFSRAVCHQREFMILEEEKKT